MESQTEPKDSGRKKNIIIVVFAILVVALVICIALLVSRQGKDPQRETPGSTASAVLERGFVDQENADDIMAEMEEKVAEGMFECKMSTTWTFDNADAESPNSYVANVESNQHTIYFDVYEDATNELLYSSPMLPVGTEITDIKLDKGLSKGEYDAVVMYTLVDEDYHEVSTVGFHITIIINH